MSYSLQVWLTDGPMVISPIAGKPPFNNLQQYDTPQEEPSRISPFRPYQVISHPDQLHFQQKEQNILERLTLCPATIYCIYPTPTPNLYHLAYSSSKTQNIWKYSISLNNIILLYTAAGKQVFTKEQFNMFLNENFSMTLEKYEEFRKTILIKEIHDEKHFIANNIPILIADNLIEGGIGTYIFFSYYSKDFSPNDEQLGLAFVDRNREVQIKDFSIEEIGVISMDGKYFITLNGMFKYLGF